MSKAPIAFFAYKRPWHTEKALEALSRCEGAAESELFIYCEGAKQAKDAEGVAEVRKMVKSRKWCGTVYIIERDKNLGCANSIIQGVTEVCNRYGRIIVIEDDLLVSRYFLDYMNTSLDLYENNEPVMQIAGHMFPVEIKSEMDALFLPFTTSWGWATWKRAWDHFDGGMKNYVRLKEDRGLRNRFDLEGAYPYFKMLKAVRKGRVDTWDIQLYLSVFMCGGLALFPSQTLIQNIGFDGSGTHSKTIDNYLSDVLKDFRVSVFPSKVEVSEQAYAECKKFLRNREGGIFNKIKKSFSEVVNRCSL